MEAVLYYPKPPLVNTDILHNSMIRKGKNMPCIATKLSSILSFIISTSAADWLLMALS